MKDGEYEGNDLNLIEGEPEYERFSDTIIKQLNNDSKKQFTKSYFISNV